MADGMSSAAPAGVPARRRGTLWWVLLILVALGVAGFFWWRSRGTKPRYVTAAVTRGDIQRSVGTTGALNPLITVQVGSYVSGTVKSLGCDFNTEVTVGKVCATIDPVPFQLIVDQDRAELGTAVAQLKKDQAALTYAKIAYERDSKLLAEGTVSQDTVDNDKSVYDQGVAQVGLDQASIVDKQAALKAAQVNLDYTRIVSPVVGTVITRSIDVGQTVAASLQSPTLFLIGKDLTKMQVDTNVSESDVADVRTGQESYFSVQAYPGRVFHGKVWQIRRGPITVQNVVTYDVVVSFDNPNRLLFPGMTADTHIVTAEHDHVLRVPLPAVRFTPEGIGHDRRGAGAGARFQAGGTEGTPAPGAAPGGSETASATAPETTAGPSEGATAASTAAGSPAGAAGGSQGGGERHHRPDGSGGWSRRPGKGAPGEGAPGAPGEHHHRFRRDGGEGAAGAGGTGGPGGAAGAGAASAAAGGAASPGRTGAGAAGPAGAAGQAGGPAGGGAFRRQRGGAVHRARVWVLQADGTLRPVDVTLGLDDGTLIEVSSPDLHPGDKVVVNEVSQEERRRNAQGLGQGQFPGQARGGGQFAPGGGPRL